MVDSTSCASHDGGGCPVKDPPTATKFVGNPAKTVVQSNNSDCQLRKRRCLDIDGYHLEDDQGDTILSCDRGRPNPLFLIYAVVAAAACTRQADCCFVTSPIHPQQCFCLFQLFETRGDSMRSLPLIRIQNQHDLLFLVQILDHTRLRSSLRHTTRGRSWSTRLTHDKRQTAGRTDKQPSKNQNR